MNRSWIPIGGLCVAAALFGYWLAGSFVQSGPPEAIAASVNNAPAEAPPTEPEPVPAVAAPTPAPPAPVATAPKERAPEVAEIRRRLLDAAPVTRPAPAPAKVIPRSERPAQDGDPEALVTGGAMDEIDMSLLLPSHEDYDEVVEAQQRFNAFELAIRAEEELTQEVFEEVKAAHLHDLEAMLERSEELAAAGFVNEADSLILEWDSMERSLARRVE